MTEQWKSPEKYIDTPWEEYYAACLKNRSPGKSFHCPTHDAKGEPYGVVVCIGQAVDEYRTGCGVFVCTASPDYPENHYRCRHGRIWASTPV